MDNFSTFSNCILNNTSIEKDIDNMDAYKVLLDAYSTYLVSRKYSVDYIRGLRSVAIINYFKELTNCNNTYNELQEYYKHNIKDYFNKKLDAPRCPFYVNEKIQRDEKERQQFEDDTNDVSNHYRDIEKKYNYYGNIKENNEDNYSDIDIYYDEQSSEYTYDSEYEEYSSYDYEEDYQNDECENEEYYSEEEYY